jgi:hypothetical protein
VRHTARVRVGKARDRRRTRLVKRRKSVGVGLWIEAERRKRSTYSKAINSNYCKKALFLSPRLGLDERHFSSLFSVNDEER